jgi:hypothetical protein
MRMKLIAHWSLLAVFSLLAACGAPEDPVIVGDNNGAITGIWAIVPDDASQEAIYFESDGMGNITAHGYFDQATPAGTYAVMKTGEVHVTLSTTSAEFKISGAMESSTTASFSHNDGATTGSMVKVTDLSLLQGNITGTLTETSGGSAVYNADLTVSSDGSVSPGTVGSAAVISGKAYDASGTFVIFLVTDGASLPLGYDQILIWGSSLANMNYKAGSPGVSGGGSLSF